MLSSITQGIQDAFDHKAQACNDVSLVATNWFVNRCPLVTRTPRVPVGSTTFAMIGRPTSQPRPAEPTISPKTLGESVISRWRAESHRPRGVVQYCQTWQHPIQVIDRQASIPGFDVASGLRTPFEQTKMDALQCLVDDMEVSSCYGRGEDPTIAGRPKQKGLKTQLSENSTTKPVNSTAYRPTDLIRDTLEKARQGGGDPDVLMVSTNFMAAFATWGHAVMRVDAGTNVFGVKIDVFESPFLGGITIIEAPLLKPFTVVALTSAEVRMRMKRNEYWSPRGSIGEAFEGDWIAEGAIEIDNPSHHAWLEGVTGFAKH